MFLFREGDDLLYSLHILTKYFELELGSCHNQVGPSSRTTIHKTIHVLDNEILEFEVMAMQGGMMLIFASVSGPKFSGYKLIAYNFSLI